MNAPFLEQALIPSQPRPASSALRPMSRNDWMDWAGCEGLGDGQNPEIAELAVADWYASDEEFFNTKYTGALAILIMDAPDHGKGRQPLLAIHGVDGWLQIELPTIALCRLLASQILAERPTVARLLSLGFIPGHAQGSASDRAVREIPAA